MVIVLPAVAAVSHRRHSWGHANPATCRDNTRSVFGSTDRNRKAGPDSLASQQRHFLPEDLAGALKWLDDVEIDALLAAVTTEAECRGRRPPSPAKEKPVADAKRQRRPGGCPGGRGFVDHWQAECSASRLQSRH